MSTEHTQKDGNDGEKGTSAVPEYKQKFIDLSAELEKARGTKDAVEITIARQKLKLHYMMLQPAEQEDIQRLIQQEIAELRVTDERSVVNSAAHRILNVPVLGMRALAATVPQFTGATLDLIVTTLGLGAHGIWSGLSKSYRKFQQAS